MVKYLARADFRDQRNFQNTNKDTTIYITMIIITKTQNIYKNVVTNTFITNISKFINSNKASTNTVRY